LIDAGFRVSILTLDFFCLVNDAQIERNVRRPNIIIAIPHLANEVEGTSPKSVTNASRNPGFYRHSERRPTQELQKHYPSIAYHQQRMQTMQIQHAEIQVLDAEYIIVTLARDNAYCTAALADDITVSSDETDSVSVRE
jgi:hypothetical protein